jgi:uncharacterized membrane protein
MTVRASAGNRVPGLVLAFVVLGWASSLVLAPYLARQSQVVGGLVYAVGALICHQQPARSFYLAGAQLPVCARCEGLYLGAAAGVLAWTLLARRLGAPWPRGSALTLLGLSSIPTAATVVTALAGVGDPSNAWRFALAVPLGLVGGMVVGAVVSEHLK